MRISGRRPSALRKRRVAVSEVLGSLIMIAVTLIAGVAVFGFINGQAGASSSAVGHSASTNINFLNEKMAVVAEHFAGCSTGHCTSAAFWAYNYGQVAYTLKQLQVQSLPGASKYLNVIFNSTGYAEYDSSNVLISTCASNSAGGFSGASQIPQGNMTSNPYSVTIPSSAGCNTMNNHQTYTLSFTGIYGSTAHLTVNATGV
jgi:flagellin-like protein